MKIAKRTIIAGALALLSASGAQAFQFKLPAALGGNAASADTTAAANAEAGDPATAQDSLVRTFVASRIEVLNAQEELAKAYDLNEQADILASERQALSSGGVTEASQIQTSMDKSAAANDAIAAKQAGQATLSEEGKRHYAASLPHFVKGVVGTQQLIVQVAKFTTSMKKSLTGGGLAGLGAGVTKLKAGLVVAKGTPAYSKQVFDMFHKTMAISQSNGIKAPADATQALTAP
jgi:hypothetical protein